MLGKWDFDEFRPNAAYLELVEGIADLAKAFRDNNNPIICLQYVCDHGFNRYTPEGKRQFNDYAMTHRTILNQLDGYDKCFIKWKRTDNGGKQVHNTVKKHNLPKNLLICGINSACCVQATQCHLDVAGYKTSVVSELTRNVFDDECAEDHCNGVINLVGYKSHY